MKTMLLIYLTQRDIPDGITEEMKNLKHKVAVEKVENGILEGKETVVITNPTADKKWDVSDYIALAKKYNYDVFIADEATKEIYEYKEEE